MSWHWRFHLRHRGEHRCGPGPFGHRPPPRVDGPFGQSLGPFGRAILLYGGPAAYVRARLHRRIFAWFGISILFTGIALGSLGMLMERSGTSGTRREIERANTFMAAQFAKVWDRPAERMALAQEMARDFEVRVELTDQAGVPILAAFPDRPPVASEPCKRSLLDTRISRDGADLGAVRVCMDPRPPSPRWGVLALIVTCIILWAASGRIAVRLARPLGDLAHVAEELGRGKLDARVPVGCYEPGEVAVVAEAMNDMAARIQKQLDDQRELLATVSHELRTPLSRIRLLTEIARDGGDPAHAFDEIDREVVEIDQLVAELLASSRLDFSALTKKEISAKEAAERAVSRAGLDPASVIQVRADGAPKVSADPTLLARALSNLLDNAARHGGGAKKVVVKNGGGRVAFEVEDEGPGLAPGEEERIFEAFYQGTPGGAANDSPSPSSSEYGSSNSAPPEPAPKKGALGLGLALVRRIAEAHGGRAYAENRLEGGARFVLELPSAA